MQRRNVLRTKFSLCACIRVCFFFWVKRGWTSLGGKWENGWHFYRQVQVTPSQQPTGKKRVASYLMIDFERSFLIFLSDYLQRTKVSELVVLSQTTFLMKISKSFIPISFVVCPPFPVPFKLHILSPSRWCISPTTFGNWTLCICASATEPPLSSIPFP